MTASVDFAGLGRRRADLNATSNVLTETKLVESGSQQLLWSALLPNSSLIELDK
jgi:hypothetical protein